MKNAREEADITARNFDRWSRLSGDKPYTLEMAQTDLQSAMRDCDALLQTLTSTRDSALEEAALRIADHDPELAEHIRSLKDSKP